MTGDPSGGGDRATPAGAIPPRPRPAVSLSPHGSLTTTDQVVVEALTDVPIARRRVELVERKGVGHPDTLCDRLVEAAAVALARMYQERVGTVLHYNLDKALLVAGQCRKSFGEGAVTRPIELIVGDRATFTSDGQRLPVEDTVQMAVEQWLRRHMPRIVPAEHVRVRSVLQLGSAELRSVFADTDAVTISNDTSGASGYAPFTPAEELVLGVEQFLNGPEFKARFPDTGQDVKVFGARRDERVDVTVAMPLSCVAVTSERAYFSRKDEILDALRTRFPDGALQIGWSLNALDRPGRGADGTYLTVTGTSAEDADSGQVGRGNRANGLIAFSRPTGGEAAAGKNAHAHAGKVYSVLSHRLARLIHARCPGIEEVYVHLAARIGDPVDRPWTAIQVVLPRGITLPDVERSVRDVIDAEIARLPAFRAELARGEHPVS